MIGVGVDVQSARQVKTVLTEITSEATKAMAALNRLNTGGASGGGVNMPASMGGGGSDPRFGAAKSQSSGSGNAGITGGLARNMQMQMQAMRSMVQSSKDIMKAMEQSSKQAYGSQRREIEQTIAAQARLEKSLTRMSATLRAMKPGSPYGGQVHGQAPNIGPTPWGSHGQQAGGHVILPGSYGGTRGPAELGNYGSGPMYGDPNAQQHPGAAGAYGSAPRGPSRGNPANLGAYGPGLGGDSGGGGGMSAFQMAMLARTIAQCNSQSRPR
jgi:hypothetical protein